MLEVRKAQIAAHMFNFKQDHASQASSGPNREYTEWHVITLLPISHVKIMLAQEVDVHEQRRLPDGDQPA